MAKTYGTVAMEGKANRWAIADKETGNILMDANGYGYKSKTTAHRAYAYQQKVQAAR